MGERVGGETSAEQVAGAMWDEAQQAYVAGTVGAEQAARCVVEVQDGAAIIDAYVRAYHIRGGRLERLRQVAYGVVREVEHGCYQDTQSCRDVEDTEAFRALTARLKALDADEPEFRVGAEPAPPVAAAVGPASPAAAPTPLALAREAVTLAATYREARADALDYPAALKAEQGAIALLARVEADAERRAGVRGSREWKEIERVVLEEVGALGAAGQEAARRIAARLRGGAGEVGR